MATPSKVMINSTSRRYIILSGKRPKRFSSRDFEGPSVAQFSFQETKQMFFREAKIQFFAQKILKSNFLNTSLPK